MPADSGKEFIANVSPTAEGASPVEDFTPSPSTPEEAAEEAVRKLREENKQLMDELLRKQAEVENIRKRIEREKQDFLQYSLLSTVKELLPILDGFERALESSGSGEEYRKGVALIHQQFAGVLQKLGLKRVETKEREFDPRLHEAVAIIESDQHPEHRIVEEMQPGYTFRDRLVRPAMVKVSKGRS